VDCVSFLLVDGDRFLAERRRPDRDVDPGAVAIPGGHLEQGETTLEALHREVREELGLAAGQARFICTLLHPSQELRRLHYFAVSDWSGEIENNEAEALLWLSFHEARRLDLPVDHVAIGEYQRLYGSG
jgi:mutator protein MutT